MARRPQMGHLALEKTPVGTFDDDTSQDGVTKDLDMKGVLSFE